MYGGYAGLLRVEGLEFRVQGSRFRIEGLGFRLHGLGVRVYGGYAGCFRRHRSEVVQSEAV